MGYENYIFNFCGVLIFFKHQALAYALLNDWSFIAGEWEYTTQVSREVEDGTTQSEQVQRQVKGDKTFFKTEFQLVEYQGICTVKSPVSR